MAGTKRKKLRLYADLKAEDYIPDNLANILIIKKREQALIRCIANDLSNKQIASILGKSEQTIKNQIYELCHKINVPTRLGITVAALKDGIINIDEIILQEV